MNAVEQRYMKLCKNNYATLGFIKYGKAFARIRNDVLQFFTLKRSCFGPIYTVTFDIIPLCAPVSFPLWALNGEDLHGFLVDCAYGWSFEPLSEKSMEVCANLMVCAIDEHLIPLFNKCTNCKSALPEWIKLNERLESNRQARLQLMGETDCAVPLCERMLFDANRYYMALKANDYDYVRRYLEFQVKHLESSLQEMKEKPDCQPESVRQKYMVAQRKYAELLAELNAGNAVYFDQIIQTNEAKSLSFLAAKYPKLFVTGQLNSHS